MPFELKIPSAEEYDIASGYETCPDDSYKTTGFVFATKDDEEPEFRVMNNEPKVMVRFVVSKHADNPPVAALTAPEFVALVRSFGADSFAPQVPQSTNALYEGKKAVDSLAKPNTLTIITKNGYVNANKNPILCPSRGIYTVRFKGAQRKDRENSLFFQVIPSQRDGWKPQRQLIFTFEIVGDGNGNPCPFNGFEITQWMDSPFIKEITLADGSILTAADHGGPLMWPGKKAPKSQIVWSAFIKHFTDLPTDYEWQSDPALSVYGVNECEEPQFVFVSNASKVKKLVRVSYHQPEGRSYMTFSLNNDILDALNADIPSAMPTGPKAADVIDYIKAFRADSEGMFNDDGTPTAEGRAWLVETMLGGATEDVPETSLYGISGITRRVSIGDLTDAEAARLFATLQKVWEPTDTL